MSAKNAEKAVSKENGKVLVHGNVKRKMSATTDMILNAFKPKAEVRQQDALQERARMQDRVNAFGDLDSAIRCIIDPDRARA